MTAPIQGRGKWSGVSEGETWEIDVEVDCFAEAEPYVVSIGAKHEDADGKSETLSLLSAEQAREMAAVLLVAADGADFNNARKATWDAEQGA